MNVSTRRKLFYLFKEDNDIVIHEMTDVDTAEFWKRGKYWEDMPQTTRSEADALREHLLTEFRSNRVQ